MYAYELIDFTLFFVVVSNSNKIPDTPKKCCVVIQFIAPVTCAMLYNPRCVFAMNMSARSWLIPVKLKLGRLVGVSALLAGRGNCDVTQYHFGTA
jgi:hypothetical protein